MTPTELDLARLVLQGETAHRLLRVMRLGPGDWLRLCDGQGREAAARLVTVTRHQVEVEREALAPTIPPPREIRLIPCQIKHARMDWLVAKAVELGATHILPAHSEHTVVRADADGGNGRLRRFERIVREAARQCGTRYLPTLENVRPLMERIRTLPPGGLLLMASLAAEARPILEIDALRDAPQRPVTLIVGPEGGFSEGENDAAATAGAVAVRLGPRILRAETAALCALALIQSVGDIQPDSAERARRPAEPMP